MSGDCGHGLMYHLDGPSGPCYRCIGEENRRLRDERDALQWARNAELTYVIKQIKEIGRTLGASMDDGFCYSTHNLAAWATNRRDNADVVKEHAAALAAKESER